jgi:hypothetical protein
MDRVQETHREGNTPEPLEVLVTEEALELPVQA